MITQPTIKNSLNAQVRRGTAVSLAMAIRPTGGIPARWLHDNMRRSLDPVWSLLVERGGVALAGELSLVDHALRTASLAHEANADDRTIIASLLHNIGHLVQAELASVPGGEQRDRHHVFGAAFLSLWFGPDITEPIRLHVAAKRYLCAVEPDYFKRLSPRARLSLTAQGGPFSQNEISAFLSGTHATRAVELRRYADLAHHRAPDLHTLRFFRQIAERCVASIAGGR